MKNIIGTNNSAIYKFALAYISTPKRAVTTAESKMIKGLWKRYTPNVE